MMKKSFYCGHFCYGLKHHLRVLKWHRTAIEIQHHHPVAGRYVWIVEASCPVWSWFLWSVWSPHGHRTDWSDWGQLGSPGWDPKGFANLCKDIVRLSIWGWYIYLTRRKTPNNTTHPFHVGRYTRAIHGRHRLVPRGHTPWIPIRISS